jgi:hypothetical protein
VKIAHDVKVVEADHKAGKLIRIRAEVRGDEILSVQVRGDFFALPKEAVSRLEEALTGVRLDESAVSEAVNGFYGKGVQIPGISPGDFTAAIMKVKQLL